MLQSVTIERDGDLIRESRAAPAFAIVPAFTSPLCPLSDALARRTRWAFARAGRSHAPGFLHAQALPLAGRKE